MSSFKRDPPIDPALNLIGHIISLFFGLIKLPVEDVEVCENQSQTSHIC